MHPCRAITEALIFKIKSEGNGKKTDALAEKLREVVTQRNDVKAAGPTKTVEIRLTGLDNSVTSQEIAEAVAGLE